MLYARDAAVARVGGSTSRAAPILRAASRVMRAFYPPRCSQEPLLRDARDLREPPLGHDLLFPQLLHSSPFTTYIVRFLLLFSRIVQTFGIPTVVVFSLGSLVSA